jgi:hypothetical protein
VYADVLERQVSDPASTSNIKSIHALRFRGPRVCFRSMRSVRHLPCAPRMIRHTCRDQQSARSVCRVARSCRKGPIIVVAACRASGTRMTADAVARRGSAAIKRSLQHRQTLEGRQPRGTIAHKHVLRAKQRFCRAILRRWSGMLSGMASRQRCTVGRRADSALWRGTSIFRWPRTTCVSPSRSA